MGNIPKYKVILTLTENGQENVVGVIRPTKVGILHHGTKAYVIDFEHPLYIRGMERVYVVNSETGTQLLPSEGKLLLRPDELDVIVSTKIVREITSAVHSDGNKQIIAFVIGAIIGILAGYIIGTLILQGKIDALVKELTTDIVVVAARCVGLW